MKKGVNLYVEPETAPLSREVFIKDMPPFSVALDGYVYGAPFFDPTGPRSNFNHHEEVDRSATLATCEQVLLALREGFFETYRDAAGMKRADIYVNDCDQDVCLSAFLLMNPSHAENMYNPILNRLVAVEGRLDASSGTYPLSPELELMRQIAWIFEPYTEFRNSGKINDKTNVAGFESVIELCGERIRKHLVGKGGEVELDTRYEVIERRYDYAIIREIGQHARISMFDKGGVSAFLSVGDQSPGSYRYTIGKRSVYIPFPVEGIISTLNALDPNVDGNNRWGGGNLVGGSPRATGSALPLDEVVKIIEQVKSSRKL